MPYPSHDPLRLFQNPPGFEKALGSNNYQWYMKKRLSVKKKPGLYKANARFAAGLLTSRGFMPCPAGPAGMPAVDESLSFCKAKTQG
jgi:hypothetical protein